MMLRTMLGQRRLLFALTWPSLLLYAGYQAINFFVPNADMILATRVLAVGFYVPVLYIYWPDAYAALFDSNPEPHHYLIVGIWVSFTSHLGQDIFAILYRLYPHAWLLNSELPSPIIMLSVLAAVLHVRAPGAVDGIVPRRNRVALGSGIGAATMLVAALLFTRPDIGPLLDRARPYISDFWKTGSLHGLPHEPT